MDNGILVIRGGSGDDYITAVCGKDEGGCHFTIGNQSLYGGANDDYLVGYAGDDKLYGGLGNDYLCGDQGNDHLWGEGNDDILVGGTGDDYINGGSGRDTFRCRSAASAISHYDGGNAATDCGDSTANVSIEVTRQRDPYQEWAYMTEHRNKITYHALTTSNPALLLSDCRLGASILMSRQIWDQDKEGIRESSEEGDQFGYALASGDFNGDNAADLAVGVPYEDVGTTSNAGLVNVLYGSHDGLSAVGNQLWNQGSPGIAGSPEAYDLFGRALAAGDFNGDGFDDLAIGVPGESIGTTARAGAVNILFGSRDGLTSDNNKLWYQNSSGIAGRSERYDGFGASLAAGDFNGDSFADLAVGVPSESIGTTARAGAVNIVYGSRDGLTSDNNKLWYQNSSGIAGRSERHDLFGLSLAAGDFNGDSFADLAVGVPFESIGTTAGAGAVNIVYGSRDGLTSDNNKLWYQNSPGIAGVSERDDKFGHSLAAGDLDGDSFADLAIGVPGESIGTTARAGAVNIVYGSRDGLTGLGNPIWNQGSSGIADSPEAGDFFGSALAIGDFNGVGSGDLAVGVPTEGVGTARRAGAVNVFYSDMPLHTTHKQYGPSCGYTSLNMVLEYLGLADHSQRLFYSRDLDEPANPVDSSEWGAGRAVDVGYLLSMEHIMYEAFHKARADDPNWFYRHSDCDPNGFMDGNGRLNTIDWGNGAFYEIQYNIGHVVWNPATGTATGHVQKWLECCPGVGYKRLSYVANEYSHGVKDARGLGTTLGSGGNFENFDHLKAVIKGFIDHGIPLVLAVEKGGHYNALIGYRESGDLFYIYTADPLDGGARPFYSKPMRWKRIRLTPDALSDGAAVVSGMILYGHSESSCVSGGWAREIDSRFHSNILCG
jgi:hypothetical protein